MARKRITESDLLDFRARADELAREVEQKYEKLDRAAIPIDDIEEREKGILLIYHSDIEAEQAMRFAKSAKAAGFAVEAVALKLDKAHDITQKRTPDWEKLLDQAQAGYAELSRRARSLNIVGTGDGAVLSIIIAEQYPVDSLAIIGAGPAMKPFAGNSGFAKLAKLAKNNLFSIVCPVMALTPEDCGAYKPSSVKMFIEMSRSDDVRLDEYPGMSVPEMWTKREHELENRIFAFINEI